MARSATPMVKLKPDVHARLQEIAREDDQTMGELVGVLLEKYERERFWKGVADDLEKFRADTDAYQRYRDEFTEWDNQTTASLAAEPPYEPEEA
ncbi:MAG: hypothetical protein M9953_03925 [Thermomicrobiales bacterium]|nr:hypothetical protein [Thermomicrobiales bacterium]MCO5219508.1 hypothetical protein [Thermomicrobiales bacterium]MCO5224466.1 hypothetical protein [Thermomicrobiales bacterium]MCO5228899.1 hypothetical protein [Thermomicrobiales bacterium]